MKILNYGSMNIDHVYTVDHMVQPGETLIATDRNLFNGGKGLNQSVAIAKAGGEVYHAGMIGDDGDMLLRALEQAGVRTDFVRKEHGPSCHTFIQVDKNGQNSIVVYNNPDLRMSADDIDALLASFGEGDIVVLQNETWNSPLVMKKAAERGMQVVFNPSPINEGIREYPLESAAWLLMNEIEGAAITGGITDPDQILAALQKKYPGIGVVLTLGGDGAMCLYNGEVLRQPIFPVKAVDTTAAGDTFTGYFISGLASGMAMPDILRRAARASSITVSRPGAADSIPTLAEIEALEKADR